MGAQASKQQGDGGVGAGGSGSNVTLSQSLINKISPSSASSSSKAERRQDIDTTSPSGGNDKSPSSQEASSSSASSSSSPSSSSPSSSTSPSSLASSLTDGILPSSRQSHLDSSVRSAISSELSRLRKQEADVTAKINAALKEESLAIEKKNNKEGGAHRSAHALQKELDSVKEKIQRHNTSRKAVEDTPGVKEARDAVVKCYRDQPKRTLDCYREVKSFTDAVEQAERNFIASLK